MKIKFKSLNFLIFIIVIFIICLTINSQEENMVLIPAGEFIMGSNTGFSNEVPERKVYVKAFYIDKYEVSNIDYKKFIDATGYPAPKHWNNNMYAAGEDNYPVVNISYYDAVAYAKYVGKRLPTEEEWEKAARFTDGRRYPWGNEWNKTKCNTYVYLANNGPKPVNSYPEGKSMYGCYNMSGNVWEWTSTYYKLVKENDSFLNKKYIVVKGGSWLKLGNVARCSVRDGLPPNEGYADVGFRCVKDIP